AEPAPSAEPSGTLTVLLGGRPAGLPVPALAYPQGVSLGAVSAAL
ncbi:glutamate racemase, partial [Streptomyces halstedii]|nr:glutamate racemase [Streptomyces halstedii]